MRHWTKEASAAVLPEHLRERAADSVAQLRAAVAEYKSVCCANSLGAESVVLTDLIWGEYLKWICSASTPVTYSRKYTIWARLLEQRFARKLRFYYPQAAPLEVWVDANGINGFREGLEQRRGCCAIRKVEPFRRALLCKSAWVTGIRRSQSASRSLAARVEWDHEYGLHKVSPLLDWTETEIWEYIRRKRLPYNALDDMGFPSIGCAPGTRAVLGVWAVEFRRVNVREF
jgi:phosphoadenosine phosphosulfate reductase